ncbi:hypothetical protein [Geodermatophilus sp. URMC 65]
MSSPTLSRRPLQRLGLAGIGSAVLLVGIASPAAAAEDVVVSLAPTQVVLLNYPTENYGELPMDPMTGPTGALEPVAVQYGETLTVDLADELDPIDAEIRIVFPEDADADGVPDHAYSTASTPDPSTANAIDPLVVTVVEDNDLEITLPTDDGVNGPLGTLSIAPVGTVLGPEFTVDPLIEYELDFSSTTPIATTLHPELVAIAQVPCALGSATPCPVAVTAGTTFTLELTADSVLRDLGLTDLTGVEVALQSTDDPTAAPVPLQVQVSGSTATVALPAGLAAGSYALVLGQPMTSGLSIVVAELSVSAPVVPTPPAAETVAPAPLAVTVVNAGLRSNTGVEAVETGSTGTVAIAAGAGMLVLAGVGGVAVARTRRRPAAEGGTCA